MTEAQWLASNDPRAMLDFLSDGSTPVGPGGAVATDRKCRLFACAVWRLRWGDGYADLRGVEAFKAAEAFADGSLDGPGLCKAHDDCWLPMHPPEDRRQAKLLCSAMGLSAARGVLLGASPAVGMDDDARSAALLREVVGNPWRPLPVCPPLAGIHLHVRVRKDRSGRLCRVPDWLTATALVVAQAAYDERVEPCGHCVGRRPGSPDAYKIIHPCRVCGGKPRPVGALDGARFAVLSDALEEAGCADDALLAHLRSPGPHVRGCHVIDALLGKE